MKLSPERCESWQPPAPGCSRLPALHSERSPPHSAASAAAGTRQQPVGRGPPTPAAHARSSGDASPSAGTPRSSWRERRIFHL